MGLAWAEMAIEIDGALLAAETQWKRTMLLLWRGWVRAAQCHAHTQGHAAGAGAHRDRTGKTEWGLGSKEPRRCWC